MKLSLINVCNIKSAEVKLDGITVIAGLNNTGKSTIGKAMYVICNSLNSAVRKIEIERIESIARELRTAFFHLANFQPLAEIIFAQKAVFTDVKTLAIFIREHLYKMLDSFDTEDNDYEDFISELPTYNFNNLAEQVLKILEIPNKSYRETFINRNINDIFGGNINNVKSKSSISKIKLSINNYEIAVEVQNNKVSSSDTPQELSNIAFFLDDPSIIHSSEQVVFPPFVRMKEPKKTLFSTLFLNEEISATEEILIDSRIPKILSRINQISKGKLVRQRRTTKYLEEDFELPAENLSTGLKVILLIKTLLSNGSLSENDILILDEPEIHLHPEWQLVLAEIIVLFQKYFNLTILLTTHSHYFLNAIETYSKAHSIGEKCSYYLSQKIENYFAVKEISGDLEELYEKFATPLQTLEDLEADYAD